MPTSCVAVDCTNNNMKELCKERKISFHKFPHSNPELLKIWLTKIKRENFTPSANSRICSEHFEEMCFKYQPFTGRRFLTTDAIPTIFSFKAPTKKRKRTHYTFGCTDSQNYDPGEGTSASSSYLEVTRMSQGTQTDVGFYSLISELAIKNEEIDLLKESLQKRSLDPAKMKDVELRALVGFNKELFFKSFSFFNLGNDVKNDNISAEKQYMLFLLKLRTGISLEFIAYIFQMSPASASRIFCRMTDVLYKKLKCVCIWPSKSQVKEFMPLEFKKKYPECRLIIDCTEINIQKPFSPKEQQLTFSCYKNANTMKALVGIAPSGGISFISDLWCGSISDKALFQQSNLLQLLENGDVVLADKGFTISKELESIGCKLVSPLFLKDKVQFSIIERAQNKSVSHLRVHVERAISRIKTYKYFEGAISYNSLHNLNQVFI